MADSNEHDCIASGDLCLEAVTKCERVSVGPKLNMFSGDGKIYENFADPGCTFDGEASREDEKSAQTVSVADKISMAEKVLNDNLPNGCIRPRSTDDNGIVKVTDQSIKEFPGDTHCSVDTESASNITTDSEECPTPSTDKTQLSDSESHGEDSGKLSPSADVSPLCDSLVSASISDTVDEKQDAKDVKLGVEYIVYDSEQQMPDIMRLITKDLSEPYSIYTYRYFIHNWPKLCFLVSRLSNVYTIVYKCITNR